MQHKPSYEFDNRNSQEMYGYLEDRIAVLKRRIAELEESEKFLKGCLEIWSKEDVA